MGIIRPHSTCFLTCHLKRALILPRVYSHVITLISRSLLNGVIHRGRGLACAEIGELLGLVRAACPYHRRDRKSISHTLLMIGEKELLEELCEVNFVLDSPTLFVKAAATCHRHGVSFDVELLGEELTEWQNTRKSWKKHARKR